MQMRKFILATLSVLLTFGSAANAQDWPTKPITMMIGFTAGSSIDVAGRIVAEYLQKFVENDIKMWAEIIKAAGIMPE
jgi:tripartite-type tricarboxylate transporter receptor subunit TctC